jgi:hypothetical protein
VAKKKTAAPKQRTGKQVTGGKRTAAKSSSGNKNARRSRTHDGPDPGKSTGGAGADPEHAAVTQSSAAPAEGTATPAVTPDDSAQATQPQDPNSLAWMAAQAVSALNAVKASQAEKLQAMLAAAENSQPASAEQPGPEESQQAGHPDESPAVAGIPRHPSPVAEYPIAEGQTAQFPDTVPVTGEAAGEHRTVPVEQLVTARATSAGHRLPLRVLLLFGALAITGLLGYRYWFDGAEPVEVAAVPDAAMVGPSQEQNLADIPLPRKAAITVVVDEPAVNPVPETAADAADAAGQAPAATRQPESAAAVQIAPPPQSPTPVQSPQVPESPAVVLTPAAPETGTAGEPAALAERHAAGGTGRQETENRRVEASAAPVRETDTPASSSPAASAAAAPPPSRRVTRPSQPGYRNPGYGYYPQQPSWQQRYRNPGYSQYPSR